MASEDGERVPQLQRRDLQPLRRCALPSKHAAIATGRAATPRRSCTSTPKTARPPSSGCAACSRSRSGTVGTAACSSPATRSGSSRSTSPGRPSELLFASEIKALLAAGVRPEFERGGLARVPRQPLRSRAGHLLPGRPRSSCPGTRSSVDVRGGARRLRPLLVAARRPPSTTHSLPQAAEAVRGSLQDAVRSHLMSDVPLGLFLSGGIDSSALLGHMTRLLPRARAHLLRRLPRAGGQRAGLRSPGRRGRRGTAPRDRRDAPSSSSGRCRRLVWHEDEPIAFPSSVPLYFVSRLAAEDVKVVLTGEGADELFLGYNRYRVALWNARLGARLSPSGTGLRAAPLPGRAAAPPARRSCAAARSGPSSRSRKSATGTVFDSADVFSGRLQGRLLADARARRSRPTCRGAALLSLRRRAHARPAEPRRHRHLSGAAADEAGPDEHGGFDREPRAVPRPATSWSRSRRCPSA